MEYYITFQATKKGKPDLTFKILMLMSKSVSLKPNTLRHGYG